MLQRVIALLFYTLKNCVVWARAQDKIENSQLECTDWKQRTVTAHPTWLKIPFKIIMCTINQDEGWEGCLSEAFLYFSGKAWHPSKNTPVQRLNGYVELPSHLQCINSISWKDPLHLIVLIKRKLCILTDHRGKVGKWLEILSSWFLLHRLGGQRGLFLGRPHGPSKNFNKWASIQAICVIFVCTLWFTLWNSHDK